MPVRPVDTASPDGPAAAGTMTGTAVWQAFALLVPLCALVLAWATRVFRRALA